MFALHDDYEAQNRNEPSWPSQCPEASHKSFRTHLKRTTTNSRLMLIEAWLQRPTQNGQAANHRDYLLTAAWNVGLAKHIGMLFLHCCAGSCTVRLQASQGPLYDRELYCIQNLMPDQSKILWAPISTPFITHAQLAKRQTLTYTIPAEDYAKLDCCVPLGNFPKLGVPSRGPHNKALTILGSTLGSPIWGNYHLHLTPRGRCFAEGGLQLRFRSILGLLP